MRVFRICRMLIFCAQPTIETYNTVQEQFGDFCISVASSINSRFDANDTSKHDIYGHINNRKLLRSITRMLDQLAFWPEGTKIFQI